jgi:hypothetical protein
MNLTAKSWKFFSSLKRLARTHVSMMEDKVPRGWRKMYYEQAFHNLYSSQNISWAIE